MSAVRLIDGLTWVAVAIAVVVAFAAHAPVVGGALFWGGLIVGWLFRRWAIEREEERDG